MTRENRFVVGAAMAACVLASPALAQSTSPVGVWQRDTGTARVRIAPCGEKLCGVLVWVRDADSTSKVGMRVFYDMEPERQNVWGGKAFNPANRETYSGTLSVVGDKMTTTGCVLGRLICQSMYWNRVR